MPPLVELAQMRHDQQYIFQIIFMVMSFEMHLIQLHRTDLSCSTCLHSAASFASPTPSLHPTTLCVCEETADYEVVDQRNENSVIYAGLHLGGGTWARGVLLPHVFARECHLMLDGLPWWIGERRRHRCCGDP